MKTMLLDTNVLVAGLSSARGASYALLQAVASTRLRVVASPALWLEYESVLKRDSIRALHGFSVEITVLQPFWALIRRATGFRSNS